MFCNSEFPIIGFIFISNPFWFIVIPFISSFTIVVVLISYAFTSFMLLSQVADLLWSLPSTHVIFICFSPAFISVFTIILALTLILVPFTIPSACNWVCLPSKNIFRTLFPFSFSSILYSFIVNSLSYNIFISLITIFSISFGNSNEIVGFS